MWTVCVIFFLLAWIVRLEFPEVTDRILDWFDLRERPATAKRPPRRTNACDGRLGRKYSTDSDGYLQRRSTRAPAVTLNEIFARENLRRGGIDRLAEQRQRAARSYAGVSQAAEESLLELPEDDVVYDDQHDYVVDARRTNWDDPRTTDPTED